jgi:hypothetical protein
MFENMNTMNSNKEISAGADISVSTIATFVSVVHAHIFICLHKGVTGDVWVVIQVATANRG